MFSFWKRPLLSLLLRTCFSVLMGRGAEDRETPFAVQGAWYTHHRNPQLGLARRTVLLRQVRLSGWAGSVERCLGIVGDSERAEPPAPLVRDYPPSTWCKFQDSGGQWSGVDFAFENSAAHSSSFAAFPGDSKSAVAGAVLRFEFCDADPLGSQERATRCGQYTFHITLVFSRTRFSSSFELRSSPRCRVSTSAFSSDMSCSSMAWFEGRFAWVALGSIHAQRIPGPPPCSVPSFPPA